MENTLRNRLTQTTALIGMALLSPPTVAMAANITVAGATNTTQVLGAGDSLSVTNTGSITASPAVQVTSVTANFVDNGGTVGGGSAGIRIATGSDISGGIANSGMISGGISGVLVAKASNISGGITNSGTIQGNEVGVSSDEGGIGVYGASDISGGVTNSGTISGGLNGVLVQTNSDISGGVSNRAGGKISGIYGIYVTTNSKISGAITNSGTVSGSLFGVVAAAHSDISGGITNSGTIKGSVGILVDSASDISGGITNSGAISGSGIAGNGNVGVFVYSGSDISGGITNQAGGTISGGTYCGIDVKANSDISGGITNSGTISGGLCGVLVKTASDISGRITNQAGGTISGGNYGVFVKVNSDISGGIVNQARGSISGVTYGIYVATNSKISGGITNSGIISGGAEAISLNGLSGLTPITIDGGQIIGDVIDNAPANGFSPVTVGGDFTSQGDFNVSSFSVSSGVTFTFGAGDTITSNSAVSDSGTIVVSSAGSSITGGLNVNAGGVLTAGGNFAVNGALANAGTITINNGKVLTATTFTGSAGSALDVQVGRAGGSLSGGELVATGSAVDLTNTALDISIAAGSQPLVAGSTIVIANGNAAGAGPATAVRDNSFLYNFSVAPAAGNNLTLTVNQPLAYTAAANSSNNANAAQVLMVGLANNINPQINQIQSNLAKAPTSAAYNHILAATTPTVDGSAEVAALNVSVDSFNLIGDRLEELTEGRETGMAAGNGYESGFSSIEPNGGKENDTSSMMQQTASVLPSAALSAGTQQGSISKPSPAASAVPQPVRPDTMMWAQGFGQGAHKGERDDIAGYRADTWGGAAGIDTRAIADHVIAGVAVSYGHTDASSKNANNTATDVDSYQVTMYGSYQPDGRSYIDGMAAYGWNRDNTTRHAVGGVTGLDARGSYDANQVTAQAEAGREYTIGDTVLTPNLMVHAVWYDPASYTESGAGGADLHVNGNSQTLLEAGPGLKAGWVIADSSGGIVRPQLRAGYRYAVVDDKIEDTSQFTAGGGTFTTQGPSPARGSVDLGTSLRYTTPSNWNFTASYDFDWKSDYTSNAGFIRAGYRF